MATLLEIQGLGVSFGGIVALKNVSMRLERGEVHALVGPNGAGKSTLVNCVTGYQRKYTGHILLEGRSLTALLPHRIVRRGVARVFQAPELFGRLTVFENICLAASAARTQGVQALLDQFELREIADAGVNEISYGQQRLVEIARTLALEPRLLLLDEPAAGLTQEEAHKLVALMKLLVARSGITILLIEHNMELVAAVANRVTVLDHGEVLTEGDPRTVLEDPRVVEAYLGEGGGDSHA